MSRIFLVDGHSLAFRAFYALPSDMATPAGLFTNAVYGFTSMLVKLLADERPDYIVVAFDTPARTFRDEMDDGYKATRSETPQVFADQLPLIRSVLRALSIPIVEVDGVEADDVLATLATTSAAQGVDAVVVTGDRDTFQLVEDPHVRVLYNRRGVSDYVLYDEAGIVERTGVTPRQYPEYAALRGDASDNLPGVPGIGEKTAASLLQRFGSIEGIYEHLDELPPKQRQNLAACHDRVLLNHGMTVLRRDVEGVVSLPLDELRQGRWDAGEVRELFAQLSFRTLLDRLLETVGGGDGPEGDTLDVETSVVRDAAGALALVAAVQAAGERYAIEPAWQGLAGRSPLLGVAVATGAADEAEGGAAPLGTAGAGTTGPGTTAAGTAGAGAGVWYVGAELLREAELREAFTELLGSAGPPLVAFRAKELMAGLADLGVAACTLDLDVAVMAYLVDPAAGRYRLEELTLRYLSLDLGSPAAVDTGTLDFEGDAEAASAGRRAHAILALGPVLEDALRSRDLLELYGSVERPLVHVLHAMERTGVRVDVAFLHELSSELGKECAELAARIQGHAGETFNVNSTQQLRGILFDKLGLTPVKRTKTGASTDADSLQRMAGEHPIIEDLLRYREVEKLRNTYADALPPLVGPDGRLHAILNQTATATGRISSEAPNLQNIPVRTDAGREMRRAFIPDEGCLFVAADYSQIELRVLAHLADDPGLVDAFARGDDVHRVTAARVFGVDESRVDSAQRRFAKVVNYGLAYGMEAFGLAQRLDIPVDQAREILDAYFTSFPRVRDYMDRVVAEARSLGYTTTLLGRRRPLPELASANFRMRQTGERMAQNAPVQGTAADIFKLAMINLDSALRDASMRSRMVLTVHDELVLEVPDDEEHDAVGLVREVMESAYELRVPLEVDVGVGRSWADAKA